MQQGYYTNSHNEKFDFASGIDMHKKSQRFLYDETMQIVEQRHVQKVQVVEKDCLDAAQEFVEKGNKVVVVNFAGADSAGGGFLEGTSGQEERIIYRSDLTALMKYYFDEQTRDPEAFREQIKMYPLYEHLIHTPEVNIFRNSAFEALDHPFKVGILTSAAPVSKAFCPYADTAFEIVLKPNGTVEYATQHTKDLMRKIIYRQLKTAYDLGYDVIVTGAFGCGAFQNPPDVVAKIYQEVIDTYFNGAFKAIVFAILDDGMRKKHNPKGNIQPFKVSFPE